MGFCLALSLQCLSCHHPPHGDFFAVQTAGQRGAAELWEPPEFGGFLHQGWQKLLPRHLQRDKSLRGPMVGITPLKMLSALTQGGPQLSLGNRTLSKMSHTHEKIQSCFVHLMSRSKRETCDSQGPHQHVALWDSFPLRAWGVNREAIESPKEICNLVTSQVPPPFNSAKISTGRKINKE